MMAENEDWSLPLLAEAADVVNQKRVKFSYTTDFLLSLSDLDICKQPPSGFDPSILSDCQEVTQSAPEWRRPYGSSALQISKRGENGLSSGTWVESSGNSSRGVHDKTAWQTSGSLGQGRWEGRAGIVDGNGDQQSEKGPVAQDSSRRYGNQSRQSWQSPERDGLLGSGSFPRPSVHAGGPLSPKVRGNGQYQLNRSTEPYQPPWMYKPALQSRRDATDLCNDETFGSTECLSQDKAEEEKRRRASFEMMRKEQHKALQEKLKQPSGKQNIDLPYLDASENEVNIQVDNGVDDHVELPQKDHAKLPVLQVSASRPLVPPGFASTVLDKNQITRTPTLPAESDIFKSGRSTAVEECLDTAGALHMSRAVVGQIQEKYLATDLEASAKQHEVDGSISASMNGTEKPVATLLPSEVSQSPLVLQTTQNEFQGKTDDVLTNFAPAKAAGFESKTGASPEGSTSILEKLFGSAMRVNDAGSPDPSEAPVEKADEEPWNPVTQSSKFAHWFCEEEVKPAVDQPPSTAEDLLSLFASNEKGIAYNTEIKKELNKAGTIIPPEEATNIQEHVVQPLPTSVGSVSEPSHSEKLDVRSGVLTCEDLEQFILAEANASQTNIESSVKVFSNVPNLGSEQQQTDVDNQASQHLLSLLQKGTTLKDSIATNKAEEIAAVASAQPISVDGVQLLEKTLTLESLFGTAFMQELQSVEAPVSVQRASGGVRTTTDLDMPGAAFLPSDIKPAGKISHDSIPAALIHGGERRYDTSKASWLGFDGRKDGIKSEVAPSLGFENEPADDTVDIHLPEEDSLITVSSAPTNEAQAFLSSGIASKEEILLSSAMPVDIMEKLTGLDNALRDDRSMIPAIDHRPLQEVLRGPFNMMGPEFQHQQRLLGGQSLPHVPMNPLRPPYSQLEQELNRHPERFLGPTDNGFDLRHHFPPNVLQHPFHHNAGIPARFEPDHHQAMQHMVPGNLPGPHPLQPLPGGLPLQHQHGLGPFNNAPFMPDIHSVQGFPFHHRPPNFNAMEVPVPGTAGRSGHPEGLERLIEMELRANANKKPPFVPNPGGPFGPEIDMAYRYRC
ncbi:uncharacterized protein LOC116260363 [Nymphaea colorata]|nr:uncharacterized protein LOC116260363 [Nymphaea colorata]